MTDAKSENIESRVHWCHGACMPLVIGIYSIIAVLAIVGMIFSAGIPQFYNQYNGQGITFLQMTVDRQAVPLIDPITGMAQFDGHDMEGRNVTILFGQRYDAVLGEQVSTVLGRCVYNFFWPVVCSDMESRKIYTKLTHADFSVSVSSRYYIAPSFWTPSQIEYVRLMIIIYDSILGGVLLVYGIMMIIWLATPVYITKSQNNT